MNEIEQMINVIGSDAMIQGMQLFDENQEEEDGKDDEDDPSKPRKKKDLAFAGEDSKKPEEDKEAEAKRREQLMKEWSDRDRNLLDQAKAEAQKNLIRLKKDLNKNIMDLVQSGPSTDPDSQAAAIYDGNDVESRHNKLVQQIEKDKGLTEEEKEAMLRQHNVNLANIGDMMDAEKRRQDAELEKAVRDRVEKRKKALEQKYKKEIAAEVKEGELRIKIDMEDMKGKKIKEIEEEVEKRIEEAATTGDKGMYRK
jgi:hypothetical protein